MDEKVTDYDLTYLHNNPFENITAKLLLGNAERVGINVHLPVDDNCCRETDNINISEDNDPGLSSWIKNLFGWPKDDPLLLEIKKLRRLQSMAITYDEWLEISLKLDEMENNNLWKDIKESDLYDYEAVEKQLSEMRRCRENDDYEKLLYIIRTCWKRDFAGINNHKLYSKCHIGTKTLITEYIEECVQCLELLTSEKCPLDDTYIMEILQESKRSYGRAAITMSGGGTFGLVGIGVFSTLLEMNLFPKIVSGSSCGSIVSSVMCSKRSDEIKEILDGLFDHTFEVFDIENDTDTFYTHLSRLLKYGVWFDGKNLQQTMKDFLGSITFKEAFNKTGRILNITVSPATVHDQPTLLNYLTSPNVLIWSAVCASCSLPIVFASSAIYEKNTETGEIVEWSNSSLKFVDGSLNSDLPISRLSEMFNVNHTIACQVNPHISPLVKLSADCKELVDSGNFWSFKKLLYDMSSILSLEISHYCEVFTELGILSNVATKLKQLMLQSYIGDITILPELRFGEQSKTLVNPTPKFIWKCILKGARSTWKRISLIKDQYAVECAMDKYISILKSRVVFKTNINKTAQLKIFKALSSSCNSSPKKNISSSQVRLMNTQPGYNHDELRRRSESITLSEKLNSSEDNNETFQSRTNLTGMKLKNRSKRGKSIILKPEHSFESLGNMYNKVNQETKRKNKHSNSFSFYTSKEKNQIMDSISIGHDKENEIEKINDVKSNKLR